MCNVPCNISLYYSGRAFLKSVGVFPLLSVDFGTGPSIVWVADMYLALHLLLLMNAAQEKHQFPVRPEST